MGSWNLRKEKHSWWSGCESLLTAPVSPIKSCTKQIWHFRASPAHVCEALLAQAPLTCLSELLNIYWERAQRRIWELSLKLLRIQVTFYPCISEDLKCHFLVKSYVKNSNRPPALIQNNYLVIWSVCRVEKWASTAMGSQGSSSGCYEETPSVHVFNITFRNKALTLWEIHSFKSLRLFPFWRLGMQGKAATKTRWSHSCLLNFCSLCKTYEFSGS